MISINVSIKRPNILNLKKINVLLFAFTIAFQFSNVKLLGQVNPGHVSFLNHGEGSVLQFPEYPLSIHVSGKYAYVGTDHALVIVDISNPTKPARVGAIYNGTDGAILENSSSIFVSGNYAYVTSPYRDALEIIDVSNPTLPVHKVVLRDGDGGALLYRPTSVYVSGNYAYVTSQKYDLLEIIDVTNPIAPFHKTKIKNGAGGALLANPQSVFVEGNYAYVLGYYDNTTLEIVDITDPTSPVHKGSILNVEFSNVFVDGHYVYLVGLDMQIIDVSNPASPVIVSNFPIVDHMDSSTNTLRVFVSDHYAYVTNANKNSLEIIDVTNPSDPVHVSSFKNGDGGALMNGPKSLFVLDHFAYVPSEGSKSLEIIDITNPATPIHAGNLANDYSHVAVFTDPSSIFVLDNYAYVVGSDNDATSNPFLIADVSNPKAPTPKGIIINPGGAQASMPTKVFVQGKYAYIISYRLNTFEVFDVSNPESPTRVGRLANGVGGALLNGPISVFVSGHYAFVASYLSDALEIIDVNDPSNPMHVGSITNGNGGAFLKNPNGVFVVDNYAYVLSPTYDAFEIIDISDRTLPKHAGALLDGIGGALLEFPLSIFVSGDYAYVGSRNNIGGALEIIDISNPKAPVHSGSLTSSIGGAWLTYPYSIFVSGNYAYITSNADNVLEVVDISNPALPTHQAKLTYTNPVTPTSVFVSGNYAYVTLSNFDTGTGKLEIVTIYAPQNPVADEATSIESTSFTANWSSCFNTTEYYLDVSTSSDFSSYVAGYHNLLVGNVTSFNVNLNLEPGTRYYYRVRASNSNSISFDSNTIVVNTPWTKNVIILPPWPNPSSGDVHFSFIVREPNSASIIISDINGRTHLRFSGDFRIGLNEYVWKRDLSESPGLYLFSVQTKLGSMAARFILINW